MKEDNRTIKLTNLSSSAVYKTKAEFLKLYEFIHSDVNPTQGNLSHLINHNNSNKFMVDDLQNKITFLASKRFEELYELQSGV